MDEEIVEKHVNTIIETLGEFGATVKDKDAANIRRFVRMEVADAVREHLDGIRKKAFELANSI